jgi:putative two-component system response regulator
VTNVLLVDDDALGRELLERVLAPAGYSCTGANDAKDARAKLRLGAYDLVLCDMHMPGESGLDLIVDIFREHPDVAVVMVTAEDDPLLAGSALEAGAYGYIIKPFRPNEVLITVANALRLRRLEIEKKAHQRELIETLRERTARLEMSSEDAIKRLALAGEFRDDETALHVERVSLVASQLAKRMGIDEQRCHLIRLGSRVHDVGKIAVPDRILRNPGKLTPEDFDVMKRHAEYGHQMLAGSGSEVLEVAATIAWTHHEWWDGSGYPRGLRGEQIPVEGRITAVADVFDALTNDRIYRSAYPMSDAIKMMSAEGATHFDPTLLKPFLESLQGKAHP